MTITEFWNAQEFSRIATYSFNRNSNLVALRVAISRATEELAQAVLSADFTQQFKLKRQLADLERQAQVSPYEKRLLNQQRVIDSTATRIALLQGESAEGRQLRMIMETAPSKVEYAAGCIPIYRDALVFYDEQGQLLRVLSICFECLYMQGDDGTAVEASATVYNALREVLAQLGHPIE